MTLELRIRVQNAVGRRVVSRRVHSIGAGLVQRRLYHISYAVQDRRYPRQASLDSPGTARPSSQLV